MIPVFLFQLCIFGVDLFGGTGCNIDQQIQDIEIMILELEIKQFDLTMDDYVGKGCMQTSFENPLGYGKGHGSQGWGKGMYYHHVNGTLYTETFCSIDVWNVFEDNQSRDYYYGLLWDGIYPEIDYEYGRVYYDGEWLRYDSEEIQNQPSVQENP